MNLSDTDQNGYLRFNCWYEIYKCKKLYIHTLVATTFLDNPNNYRFVKHIDGDKLNNNVENLKWMKNNREII